MKTRNWFGLILHPVVFFTSSGLIIFSVIFSLIFLDSMLSLVESLQSFITRQAGWSYVLSVNIFLGFTIYLIFSRFANIRLGGPDAKPDFSVWSWFAMLFSAGMGIGLLFYSVAEPMFHFVSPPLGAAGTVEAARLSMGLTFFHWGLHAWGIYALLGVAMAFFAFNRGLPLTVRSVFYPLLKNGIYGPLGDLIDITAVMATLLGIATSLGLGVKQINAGLDHLFQIGQSSSIQIILITGITAMATTSVALGLDRGIRRLSELNMHIGFLLLLFMLIVGPTLFLFNSLVQNIGYYLQNLLEMGTWTEAYSGTNWQDNWTLFYWAWWICWSPFVGMFIARISRGRTIREFLLGVLLAPTCLTFIWLTVFGNTAIFVELYGNGGIACEVQNNMATALFVLLAKYPFSFVTSLLGIIVVVTFFVTSSDSGSLVIDIITAGGNTESPVQQRIFWAVLQGIVAATLLLGGGLKALQTAVLTLGLPFTVVLLFVCVSLVKGLREST